MSLEFQLETFVDVYHSIFSEYLSSVVAKLPKENEKYRAMKEELSSLYDKYPKILDIFDMDKAEWSYVKKKYKLNTTNFLFLCNC